MSPSSRKRRETLPPSIDRKRCTSCGCGILLRPILPLLFGCWIFRPRLPPIVRTMMMTTTTIILAPKILSRTQAIPHLTNPPRRLLPPPQRRVRLQSKPGQRASNCRRVRNCGVEFSPARVPLLRRCPGRSSSDNRRVPVDTTVTVIMWVILQRLVCPIE